MRIRGRRAKKSTTRHPYEGMNNIEHSAARAGPNMKPTNMIPTILALTLAGANSEARVMLRVRAPPMPMPAKKRRMQNVLKLCTQKSPPLKTENMMRPRMRGIFLPMRSASMPRVRPCLS